MKLKVKTQTSKFFRCLWDANIQLYIN